MISQRADLTRGHTEIVPHSTAGEPAARVVPRVVDTRGLNKRKL